LNIFEEDKLNNFIKTIRELAKKEGGEDFDGLYILSIKNSFNSEYKKFGIEGLIEFPPHGMGETTEVIIPNYVNKNFKGYIFNTESHIKNEKHIESTKDLLYKGIFCGWDNTARKARTGAAVFPCSPGLYKKWLTDIINWTKKFHSKEEQFIFINAWNEWAEGTHLEPDIKYGYAYLQSTKEALEETGDLEVKEVIQNIYKFDIDNHNQNSTWNIAYQKINDNDKVLELGCAAGYWGQYTKKHKNVEITGLDFLEFHVNEAKKTNCYQYVIKYDLNNLDSSLNYLKGTFDKIVILDVLEHLYNPAAVINWCKNFLKPYGEIIISIPNMAHKTIIQQLFLNDFNYTEYGLLDRTHIRFFTLNSFIDLLTNCNCEIVNLERINNEISEYEENLPDIINDYINIQNETNVFQYVFTVKHNENCKYINEKYKTKLNKNITDKYLNKKCAKFLISLLPSNICKKV